MFANRQLAMFGGGSNGNAYGPVETELNGRLVLPMDEALIEHTIGKYADAAAAAKALGFGMVTVHAGHGWMLHQFLSPLTNTRTDRWGGASIENRARLLLCVLEAIRRRVGPGFPIEVRISGSEAYEGGYGIEEGVAIARQLDGKCDLIHVSAGNHEVDEVFTVTHPSMFMEDGCNVKYAAEIRKHVRTPVAAVGALSDPAQMEEIIALGQADVVEMARQLLADPDTPNKLRTGRENEVRRCMRCLSCFSAELTHGAPYCAINPETGRELEIKYDSTPVRTRKRVLIAGGGIGGMQAALSCAERGHDVTLVEKSDKLGGNLHPAGAPYFKEDIIKLCKVLVRRVEKAGVKVLLNTEATPEYVKEFAPDALFVAIGSNELRPPIKGMDGDNVIMAIDAELHPEKLGERVAIMGGGLVGAEAACSFAHEGKKVSVIEMKDDVALEVNSFYRGGLMPHVEESAELYVKTKVKEITPQGVLVENEEKGEFLIEADTVVCALGFRAPFAAVDALCDMCEDSVAIGDCRNVGQIYHAMTAGYYAARTI